jgi:hypothetical protein
VGFLLAGQTWSTFGDVRSLPLTVDLDGPNSSLVARTVQIRFRPPTKATWRWAIAIESPKPEIAFPDSLLRIPTFQSWPDLATRLSLNGDFGHVQLSGILRNITVRDIRDELSYLLGYGGLFSGAVGLGAGNRLLYQIVGGQGISSLLTEFDARSLDVVFNPDTNEFETVGSYGGYVSLRHDWKANLFTHLTAGMTGLFQRTYYSPDTLDHSEYLSVNLFWEAVVGTRIGIEYDSGQRTNKDGQSGTANRMTFIMYYDF